MTNREWMESLSDRQLAAFLVGGIPCRYKAYPDLGINLIELKTILSGETDSKAYIFKWLTQEQELEIPEDVLKNEFYKAILMCLTK